MVPAAIRIYQGRLVGGRGSSEGIQSSGCRVQLRKTSPDVIPNCGSLLDVQSLSCN
jgi:hypothetical protein